MCVPCSCHRSAKACCVANSPAWWVLHRRGVAQKNIKTISKHLCLRQGRGGSWAASLWWWLSFPLVKTYCNRAMPFIWVPFRPVLTFGDSVKSMSINMCLSPWLSMVHQQLHGLHPPELAISPWSTCAVRCFHASPTSWELLFWRNLLFSQILACKKTLSSCHLIHSFLDT